MDNLIKKMKEEELKEFITESDQEAYAFTEVLEKKLMDYHEIAKEKNGQIPFAFVMALDLMGKSLDTVSSSAEYELIKEDMWEFITTMFEFHDETYN